MKWGILGASKFARNFMGPAIHSASGNELVALATSSAEKASAFQSFCPTLLHFDHYDALLSSDLIDAVYIPLPNHLHLGWAMRALEAGKHVLCEKPMVMHAREFDQLISMRDRTGLMVAEAFMIVHHPQWLYVREALRAGKLGALRRVSGRFSFDNRTDPTNIRNRAETGGGAIRDIGVYVIGATRFATGQEPNSISARIAWENDVDVFTEINARFEGFTYGAYVSTRMAPAQEMVFHGEQGLIRLTAPFNPRVFGEAVVELHRFGHEGGGAEQTQRFPLADHYRLQVEAFAQAATAGAAYACPLEFSRGTQEVIDAVFENHETLA